MTLGTIPHYWRAHLNKTHISWKWVDRSDSGGQNPPIPSGNITPIA